MSDLLAPSGTPLALSTSGRLSEAAARLAARSKGEGTRHAYGKAWAAFDAWCTARHLNPLSGDVTDVANYVAERARPGGLSASSIGVAVAAIKEAYRLAEVPANWDDPALRMVLEGARRTLGIRPARQSAPATPDVLRLMLATRKNHDLPLGARDRAMLVLGFGGALRRSEIVGLDVGDVTIEPGRGVVLLIRRSKTDQEGAGAEVALAANPDDPEFCPVVVLERWLRHRREVEADGALFCAVHWNGQLMPRRLSTEAVRRLIKDAAEAAGLDETLYSSHALRRGFLTAAARAGAPLAGMMAHARHKTPKVTLGYVAEAQRWTDNVSDRVFRRAAE